MSAGFSDWPHVEAEVFDLGPHHGPEDVLPDAERRVLTGSDTGTLLRLTPETGAVEVIAETGGQLLGLDWLPDGRVVACDAAHGLLAIDVATGAVTTLAAEFQGRALLFCNNPATAPDGSVYFSQSSSRRPIADGEKVFIEGIPCGRLYRWHAEDGLSLIGEDLLFANGVAVSPSGDFVLCAETGRCRISRFWLTGPKAGARDVFAELPGMPDNLSIDAEGRIWCALPTPPIAALQAIHKKPVWMRRIIAALPPKWRGGGGQRPHFGFCVLDLNGNIIDRRTGDKSLCPIVTSVRQVDGAVWIGSIATNAVLRAAL